MRLGYSIGTNGISPDVINASLGEIGKDYDLDEIISETDFWSNYYEGWTEELRYLLFRYDEYLAANAGVQLNSTEWNKIWTDDASRSIEHIKPQSSGVAYIHHLGNLTMLPPR